MLFKTMSGCCVVLIAFASGGCSAEFSSPAEVAKLSRALEDGCADAPADVAGDVLSVLSSIDPLDPAEPQEYGGAACGGMVFEFDNPDEEPLHGAWVQASGATRDESDALSEGRCPERALQADYWGFKDRGWTKLAAAEETAVFAGESCELQALILQEGTFEKLRIIARVTQDSQTYPMHACVW
ncbi:MAG TPA: hypothetical protein VFN67_17190 [Polyangiales bacterium]|nr:hypothetical protein [Polyangiales bacterium]